MERCYNVGAIFMTETDSSAGVHTDTLTLIATSNMSISGMVLLKLCFVKSYEYDIDAFTRI
jgi:hypothetical protein